MTKGTGARVQTFVRSLTIQGSWNYKTMIGTGVAFSLLPILRRVHSQDPVRLQESLKRHAERFNAHPYLAELALGACARMEEDGEDPVVIRRFKMALGGALGGLGDSLVWAGWVPACVLLGVSLLVGGAPGWVALTVLVGVYNIGHFALRIWGFSTGLREGRNVGHRLSEMALTRWGEWIRAAASLLLGMVVGLLILRGVAPGSVNPLWTLVAAGGFVIGLLGGQGAWRPTLNASILVLGALLVLGAVG